METRPPHSLRTTPSSPATRAWAFFLSRQDMGSVYHAAEVPAAALVRGEGVTPTGEIIRGQITRGAGRRLGGSISPGRPQAAPAPPARSRGSSLVNGPDYEGWEKNLGRWVGRCSSAGSADPTLLLGEASEGAVQAPSE